MTQPVRLADAFASFSETWQPRVAAELNGQHVKLAKLEGAFDWHQHPEADELFWVVEGRLTLRLRDRDIELGPGELFVVPAGVEHQPVVAEGVASVVLFEPAGTRNTGDRVTERTVEAKPL